VLVVQHAPHRRRGAAPEAPEGVRFVIRSRLSTDDEMRELGDRGPDPE
jgi:hypothetical protein